MQPTASYKMYDMHRSQPRHAHPIHKRRRMIVFILIYFLAATHGLASAQSFAPSPAWKHPNITTSPEERVAIAKDAIEKTISMMVDGNGQLKLEDGNYGVAGRFFSQMAEFDMITNQTIYRDQLLKFFPQALSFRPGFIQGKDHSIAATHAYTVYSDREFLDWAELAWSGGRSYTLSEDELQSGRIFGKNVTVKPICADLTMAGGTFWVNAPNSGFVNALATGSYLIATSLLAEATTNQTYTDSATETEKFYFNHLRNAQGDLLDGIDADTCTPKDGAFPANAGLMIEGLAILASVTQRDTVIQHLLEVVDKTVSRREWHSPDGVLAADSPTQASAEYVSQYIVQGLAAIYRRNTTHSDLRDFIREYLGVQYNAVLDNTREPGSNVYAASWTGPPSSNFSFDNQTNALSMLIAAIPIRNDTLDITSGGPGTPPTTGDDKPSNKAPLNAGAIAGGVVGGLAFVALLLILVLYLIRRRRARQAQGLKNAEDGNRNVTTDPVHQVPFTRKSEKVRRPQEPAPRTSPPQAQNTTTFSESSGTSLYTGPSPTLGVEPLRFGSMVPTVELVRLLNERLQPGQWREDELPPDYVSQHS